MECGSCPPPRTCRCPCRCESHTHYFRCEACLHGLHPGHRRALSVRALYAFGDWRDPDLTTDHLGHLLPGANRADH